MKKNLKHISWIALGVFSLSLSSCSRDEWINPVSETSLTDATAFATPDRIVNQVAGLYQSLKNGNLYGSRYFIYNDARPENFLSNDGNRVTARAAWEFSEGSGDGEVNNFWSAAYLAINRCNVFLAGMAAGGDAVVGASAAGYNAEARFVRATCYYSLLQFYAKSFAENSGNTPGVPLRLTAITGSGSSDLARSTVAEVYAQILDDLNFAEANLPLTNGGAVNNTTRAHRNTAIAMKVRTYLSMSRYADVVTEANKIVSAAAPFTATSGVAHALQPNIATVFTNYTTTESIFSMPFTTVDAPGGQAQLGGYFMPLGVGGAAGIFYLNPAGVLGDPNWLASDARKNLLTVADGKTWMAKFRSPGPFLDWGPVIRYSDVLLSLAEAITRTTNTVDTRAVALLSAVRNRSDAATSYTTGDFATSTALVDAILQERNIEFVGEGIRSLDIIRLNLPYPAKAIPGFSVAAVAPSNPAYIWPTPSEESRLNALID